MNCVDCGRHCQKILCDLCERKHKELHSPENPSPYCYRCAKEYPKKETEVGMKFITLVLCLALAVAGCSMTASNRKPFVPSIKEITEKQIKGDYWYQKFTLFVKADPTADCQITRTGKRYDLKNATVLSQIWKTCRNESDGEDTSE